ncbi:sugar ABC transporter substrate-binding protein [Anaerobacillus alkaliphilus]|uniref:Sugar ABC transporter substrate-binding protein n=1 Tax=Anaerobacillus alkaliphilus TaxID=1548597 RepID=A0A4Q0VU43_9BACI|nr:sugar ABC transporter substrate-binding protein [Anaerobacillus alkaliphilus]RXJ02197.1 sugar ABC transporter substrate-binding protein [Anaerobacillus alkaliphilus]
MKKLLMFLMMALVAGLLVVGCSSSKEETSSNGDQDKTTPATEEEVVLQLWIHQTNEKETQFYLDRAAEFNEAHKGKIRVDVAPPIIDEGSSYNDAINAALVAGNLPDLIKLDGPFVASYAASEVIMPVGQYYTDEELADYVDSILEQGSYNGELYSLGAMESSVMLYYNKAIFAEAGIEAPTSVEDAWTWDEFFAVAKQLTTNDRYGLNLFMNYGVGEWMTYMGLPFVWSNGGDLLSPDGTTAEGYFNGPETVEALEFIKQLFAEGVVSISPSEMQFEEGNAAMALGGPWIALSTQDAGLDYGMMPYPRSKVAKSPSGSMAYAVTSQTKHPEEAAKFMLWMTDKESTIRLSEVTGMPPARKSAFAEMAEYETQPKKIMKDQVINSAQARPQTPAYPVLTQLFAEAFQAAALGEDVQKTLDNFVPRIERELSRFNK